MLVYLLMSVELFGCLLTCWCLFNYSGACLLADVCLIIRVLVLLNGCLSYWTGACLTERVLVLLNGCLSYWTGACLLVTAVPEWAGGPGAPIRFDWWTFASISSKTFFRGGRLKKPVAPKYFFWARKPFPNQCFWGGGANFLTLLSHYFSRNSLVPLAGARSVKNFLPRDLMGK